MLVIVVVEVIVFNKGGYLRKLWVECLYLCMYEEKRMMCKTVAL